MNDKKIKFIRFVIVMFIVGYIAFQWGTGYGRDQEHREIFDAQTTKLKCDESSRCWYEVTPSWMEPGGP